MGQSNKVLEFTFAPIQGFVNQARRTRDFWAGSYLISYLSAQAMVGVERAHEGNKIVFPAVSTDFILRAVKEGRPPADDTAGLTGSVGSLPNRFTAEGEGDPTAAAEAGAAALETAWTMIAEGVRKNLLWALPQLGDKSVQADWEVQIKTLWEIYWAVGTDHTVLDERKNWRHFMMREEQGETCTVCGERVVVAGSGLPRCQVRKLWKSTTSKLNQKWNYALDERGTERLCAVCLVKRIFPHIAEELIGWPVIVNFPSTLHFAPGVESPGSGKPAYYAVLAMDGDRLGWHLSQFSDKKREIPSAGSV